MNEGGRRSRSRSRSWVRRGRRTEVEREGKK